MRLDPVSKFLVGRAGSNGVAILSYHAVHRNSVTLDWPWTVSYKAFCEQMDLLRELGWKTISVPELEYRTSLPERTAIITFDDGYANNFAAFEALAERTMRATWFIVSRDIGRKSSWPEEAIPPQAMLNAQQLREMSCAGMSFGSHTMSHCKLTLADDETIAKELADSKKQLTDVLGQVVDSIAYPHGLYDTRVVAAARHAGYRVGLSTKPGFFGGRNDLMHARRITIFNSDTLSTFARKLALGKNDVSYASLFEMARNAITAKARGS